MSSANALPDILPRVKNAILNIVPNAEVILFGSRARGDYRSDSDWDILVVMDQAKNSSLKHRIRGRLADFLFEDDALLTALFMQKDDWTNGKSPSPVISEIRKDGILL